MATSVLRTIGCVLWLGIFAGGSSAADVAVWVRDIDAARTEAKAGNKDLFLLFTGVGWCKPCMDFDRKVLKQAAFLDQVCKSYTLVELDHTFGETPEEKARQARFAVWEKQYLINAFPTLVLADAAGMPYAVMTGYESLEVPVTLEWIAKARVARDARDREMKAATTGPWPHVPLAEGAGPAAGQCVIALGYVDDQRMPILARPLLRVDWVTEAAPGAWFQTSDATTTQWLSAAVVLSDGHGGIGNTVLAVFRPLFVIVQLLNMGSHARTHDE